jgi:hypothetical protein
VILDPENPPDDDDATHAAPITHHDSDLDILRQAAGGIRLRATLPPAPIPIRKKLPPAA